MSSFGMCARGLRVKTMVMQVETPRLIAYADTMHKVIAAVEMPALSFTVRLNLWVPGEALPIPISRRQVMMRDFSRIRVSRGREPLVEQPRVLPSSLVVLFSGGNGKAFPMEPYHL